MKIIVDAFGGDHAPLEILKGCADAVQEYAVSICLTGDEKLIRDTASQHGVSLSGMEIVHTSQVIPVEAEPTELLKQYADSSMAVGCRLLAEGKGEAFVSAGSTGALVVGASLLVKRIKGAKRVTIGTVIPSATGCYMLADAGANAECRPEMLVQFGVMASVYMEKAMGIKNPKVGLVNIGAEETKGTPLYLEAHQLLKKAPLHFVGNVEPREIPYGVCDVVVADGFTGNVILKLTEGLGSYVGKQVGGIFRENLLTKFSALLVMSGLNRFKAKMDYKEYGGAPLLGASKPVIKAHGSSDAKAIKNAVRQAIGVCNNQVNDQIAQALQEVRSCLKEES